MNSALNLDYPEGYELFQRKTLVDALLDRLKHHCITIRINGPSLGVASNAKGKTKSKI
jgi:DNA replication protein DnaC